MKTVLVVAPHPDDETLGCGGTLLRFGQQGVRLAWLVVTRMTERFDEEQRRNQEQTIRRIGAAYGFDKIYRPGLPAAALDTLPLGDIVSAIGEALSDFQPEWLLVPHHGDVHSDHRIVSEACAACSKWFRYPFLRRVMSYETLSETDFSLPGVHTPFTPQVFIDIEDHLERKLEILSLYTEECGEFPFPRSLTAVESLARLRGAQSGQHAAEAFQLLKETL